MNEKDLKIAQKIIEGNNKTEDRYANGIYDVISMIKVASASIESMEYGSGTTTIDLNDVQRTLNVAAEKLNSGTTGELIDYLSEITTNH